MIYQADAVLRSDGEEYGAPVRLQPMYGIPPQHLDFVFRFLGHRRTEVSSWHCHLSEVSNETTVHGKPLPGTSTSAIITPYHMGGNSRNHSTYWSEMSNLARPARTRYEYDRGRPRQNFNTAQEFVQKHHAELSVHFFKVADCAYYRYLTTTGVDPPTLFTLFTVSHGITQYMLPSHPSHHGMPWHIMDSQDL